MQHKTTKILTALALSAAVFAANADGLPDMMKYYDNTAAAPKTAACKGNATCNSFAALAKQWRSIPQNYRYHGFNIRQDAAKGDGYGLYRGFNLQRERSLELAEAGEEAFYAGGAKPRAQERIFAQGLAVLLYIEDKNGWTNQAE